MNNSKRQQFPKAHLWLLIPFFFTLAGFWFSYWSKFTEVPFRHHAHGLTATAWYILLIIQPWIYNRKSLKLHKQVGFIGLILAGGVVFSALQVIPYNIKSGLVDYLKYGLSFYDFLAITGFVVSVIMAMFNARKIELHARWMISTAIWALQPALARLIFIPLFIASDGQPPFEFITAIYLALAVMGIPVLIMIVLDYKRFNKIYTPYVFALCGTLVLTLLIKVMGTSQWWIDWCNNVLVRGI